MGCLRGDVLRKQLNKGLLLSGVLIAMLSLLLDFFHLLVV